MLHAHRVLPGEPDEHGCRSQLPTPREPECSMNHTKLRLVQAHLDEVVAGAERSQVLDAVARLRQPRVLVTAQLP